MSSRVFKARTGHTESIPQLCGLTQAPIQEDDYCLYLVCRGTAARPDYQITVVREEVTKGRGGRTYTKNVRETPDGQAFFSVFTGQWETYKKADGSTGRRRVYEWQTEDANGNRIPVVVWSNMVLADAAEKLGYNVGKNTKGNYVTTQAHRGDRTVGFEHQTAKEAEPAMVTVAKAALDDEAAGRVAPKEELPVTVPQADEASQEDEASLAAALGMTVKQFRSINERD